MSKKTIKIIIITSAALLSLFIIIGLTVEYIESISRDTHGEIEYVKVREDDAYLLQYHGYNYYSTDAWLYSEVTSNDVEIGCSYAFPFPEFHYFTDGTENPLYILSGSKSDSYTRNIYLREDIDYKKQIFVVDSTDIEFLFEDTFTKAQTNIKTENYLSDAYITFYLKDIPSLKMDIHLYQSNDNWYFINDGECWLVSEELIDVLADLEDF